MAYTKKEAQTIPSTGIDIASLTLTAIATGAGNGLSIDPDPSLELVFQNTTGAPINATLKTNLTVDGVALGDKTHAIPANSFRLIRRLNPNYYQQSSGLIHIEAAGAGLTLAVLK